VKCEFTGLGEKVDEMEETPAIRRVRLGPGGVLRVEKLANKSR
jgi:hypothetical protein